MKTKNIIKTGLVVAGLGALAFGAKKVADDHKLMKTQEELTAIVRDYFSEMGEIGTLYVQVYESSLERLVGGVIFEDGRHYTFVYEEDQDERAKDAMIRYESRLDAYQFLLGKFENFKAGKGFHDLPEGLFGERNY